MDKLPGFNCEIRWENRLCKVDDKLGYFHTWEHYSRPVEASPLVGGVGLLTRAFLMVHALDRWARALSDPYGLIPRLNEQILKYR